MYKRILAAGLLATSLATSALALAASEWDTRYDRPAEYEGTQASNAVIEMRDGVKLSARIVQPINSGEDTGPLPVILTITGYNSRASADIMNEPYLVERGYVHVFVDERGSGSSEGNWHSFDKIAQEDFCEVIDWVSQQPFGNGSIGTWGPSYMGITQYFTGNCQHPAHKAIFSIVPMGDAYRDIVFTGGQTNAGFIPLWVGLVGGLGLFPAAAMEDQDPERAFRVLLDHVVANTTDFAVPTIVDAVGGGESAYDSEFWRERSPLEVADNIQIPTFVVGGLNDLFQRGEPMLYERIKDNLVPGQEADSSEPTIEQHPGKGKGQGKAQGKGKGLDRGEQEPAPLETVETKLLIGPWTHLGGSSGEGLPAANVPDLAHIALQWFDRYLMGMDNGVENQPDVTQYRYGTEDYVTAPDWPHPDAQALVLNLRGDRSLTTDPAAAGEANHAVPQTPVNGLCSASSSQWTAGAVGATQLPCATDNRYNEGLMEVSFTTEVQDEPLYINGPMQANLWISTTSLEAGLVARITDVAPDGTSRELTNGLLTASMRAVDEDKSRYLDGQMIQPWHPFTADAKQPLQQGETVELNLEIFPSSFVIQKGHALRVSIGSSDLPHGLPPLTDLAPGAAGLITLYTDAEHPSSIVLPVIPAGAAQ